MAKHLEGFYNIPRDSFKGDLADLFSKAKKGLNDTFGIPGIDLGFGLGDMIVADAPEYMEELAHGADVWKGKGFGGRLDTRAGDVLGLAGLFGNMPKNLAKGVIKGIAKGNMFSMPKSPMLAQQGYIVGVKSDLADMTAHAKGLAMRAAGASVDEIFEKTKWWFDHPDKKARFEVAHGKEKYVSQEMMEEVKWKAGNQVDFDAINNKQRRNNWLENRVNDSVVMKHYGNPKKTYALDNPEDFPELHGEIYTAKKPSNVDQQINMGDSLDTFGQGESYDDLYSVFAHENQHLISGIEDFAPGGNSSMISRVLKDFSSKRINKYKAKYKKNNKLSDEDWQNLINSQRDYERFQNPDVGEFLQTHMGYLNIADESQARLVQKRLRMTQKEMDANPFYKEYDRELKDMLIFDRRKGKKQLLKRGSIENYLSRILP